MWGAIHSGFVYFKWKSLPKVAFWAITKKEAYLSLSVWSQLLLSQRLQGLLKVLFPIERGYGDLDGTYFFLFHSDLYLSALYFEFPGHTDIQVVQPEQPQQPVSKAPVLAAGIASPSRTQPTVAWPMAQVSDSTKYQPGLKQRLLTCAHMESGLCLLPQNVGRARKTPVLKSVNLSTGPSSFVSGIFSSAEIILHVTALF